MFANLKFSYGLAAVIVVLACIGAGVVIVLSARTDLPAVAEALADRTQYVRVPGTGDVEFSRSGAYAVYYPSYNRSTQRPPALNCSLISKTSGEPIRLADDYVPSNMNISVGGRRIGVLIYSATVKDPGVYSIACRYANGQAGPNVTLGVGPNYVFEFLRGVWSVARSVLGALALVCGASVLALFIVVVALLQSRARSRAAVASAA